MKKDTICDWIETVERLVYSSVSRQDAVSVVIKVGNCRNHEGELALFR